MNKQVEELVKRVRLTEDLALIEWISVRDGLPSGQWNVNHGYWSEEVLIANSCSISIGYYDRNNQAWYVAEGTFGVHKERIDKITHWMPLPINPHEIPLAEALGGKE